MKKLNSTGSRVPVFSGDFWGKLKKKAQRRQLGMYQGFLKEAMCFYNKSVGEYRQLHKIAEKGLQLPKTLFFVKERLREMGADYFDCSGGVVTVLGQGEGCVLLRADMDALPMREETDLEYRSDNGNMHACGHDMHTAMLISAARLIMSRERELSGRVALCFQPGEETLEGAKGMIEDGLLEQVRPSAAVMIHVLTGCDYKTGTVIIPPEGVGAAGADFFRVTVKGFGCHGASPHLGRDPILCASHIICALSEIMSREILVSGEAMSVGHIRAGDAANAIPDTAVFSGTLRSYNEDTRAFIKERLVSVCGGIASALRCEAVVDFTSGCPSFLNASELVNACAEIFGEAKPPCVVLPKGTRGGGSEDFSYVSRRVPSVMLALAAGERARGYTEPLHSPKASFDEAALPFGAAAYASAAISLLKKPSGS